MPSLSSHKTQKFLDIFEAKPKVPQSFFQNEFRHPIIEFRDRWAILLPAEILVRRGQNQILNLQQMIELATRNNHLNYL